MSDHLVIGYVTPIARNAVRRFPTVDWQDVRSDLFVYLYEHPELLTPVLENDPDDDEARAELAKLSKNLRNRAQRYCRREKAGKAGYSVDDEYFYSTEHLSSLVRGMFDPDPSPPARPLDGTFTRSNPAEGGNWMVMMADVKVAYSQLEAADRDALWQREGLGLLYKEMIIEVDGRMLSAQACADRHRRALKHMQAVLGGPRPKAD